LYPTGVRLDGNTAVEVVGQADTELVVEFGLVSGLRVGQHVDDLPQGSHERLGLLAGELAAGNGFAELPLEGLALSLRLSDPPGDTGTASLSQVRPWRKVAI
jgi:hypothetical protein